jgi:hypothetical protein
VKYAAIVITTALVFSLAVNTRFFWEGQLGIYAMPVLLSLVIVFFGLVFSLLWHLPAAIRERFRNKKRLKVMAVLFVVIAMTIVKPDGLFDFDKLQGRDLLVAGREGSANCNTIFKLKENHRFTDKVFCFGAIEVKGDWELKGDTIFFKHVELGRAEDGYYQFALIKPDHFQNEKILATLVRYKNYKDTAGHELFVTKNELIKKE